MPVSSNEPSLRVTVPAFAGCALAPPPAPSRLTRAYSSGAPVTESTTTPTSVPPAPSVIFASVVPALIGVGALDAQPVADTITS